MLAKGTHETTFTSYLLRELITAFSKGGSNMQKQWIVLLLMSITFLLIGCGTNSTATASLALPLPTTVHITRAAINGYPAFSYTVQDTKTVQQLYQMAQTLPKIHTGFTSCPMDAGVDYQLNFLQGNVLLQKMSLDASGCRFLELKPGPQGMRSTNSSFQTLFLKAVNLPKLLPERTVTN
jgi:hypothetical protein